MSKNLRSRDKAMLDLFDICAADSAGGNANQHFAIGDQRHWNVFDNNAALAAVNSRAHCGGERVVGPLGSLEKGPGTGPFAAPTPRAPANNRIPTRAGENFTKTPTGRGAG